MGTRQSEFLFILTICIIIWNVKVLTALLRFRLPQKFGCFQVSYSLYLYQHVVVYSLGV